MMINPDPGKAMMQDYVLVFADDAPPKQTEVTAISDEHAIDLLQKEYPNLGWTLYRSGSLQPLFAFRPKKEQTQ